MSESTKDKHSDCILALQVYLAGEDIDLRKALLPEFLYGFGRFLTEDYSRHYSPATAAECLRTLRTFLRMAIADGLVPNIDAVPSVIDRLGKEVWQSPVPVKAVAGGSSLDLRVGESIDKLLRHIEATLAHDIDAEAPQSERRRHRTHELECRCAMLYVFGILAGGLEIAEVLKLRCDAEGMPSEVFVERYGCNISLSDKARRLVAMHSGMRHCDGYLFDVLESHKYSGDPDKTAQIIGAHISRLFTRLHLPLYVCRKVSTDSLNLALEKGLARDAAVEILKYRCGMIETAKALPAIESARILINAGADAMSESWFLLCVNSASVNRTKMSTMLYRSHILGDEAQARRRIYEPTETIDDKSRGKMKALARYLFFRSTPLVASLVNSFSRHAYVMRRRPSNEFARISRSEIERLQVMLRDFPEDVELIDRDHWLTSHNAGIVPGVKVRICSGPLTGNEARVVEIKGAKSSEPVFLLEYVHGALTFKTRLSGIKLEIIK